MSQKFSVEKRSAGNVVRRKPNLLLALLRLIFTKKKKSASSIYPLR